jgi:hypothetical protein
MITRDSNLAKLFYTFDSLSESGCFSRINSLPQTKKQLECKGGSALTLENLKLHDKYTQDANNKFLPKMNRLVHNVANRATT